MFGGWPGAILAQQLLRHKTAKLSFRAVFWVSVLINVFVFVTLNAPFTELFATAASRPTCSMVALQRDRRGPHDLAAGTRVVTP